MQGYVVHIEWVALFGVNRPPFIIGFSGVHLTLYPRRNNDVGRVSVAGFLLQFAVCFPENVDENSDVPLACGKVNFYFTGVEADYRFARFIGDFLPPRSFQ